VIAPDAGEIERLGRASAVGRARAGIEEPLPVLRTEERKQHVAPRVHVVRDEEQLAEPGLPEVLGQQLDVAAPEIVPRGWRDRRGSANQVPQLGDRAVHHHGIRKGRAEQAPDRAMLHAAPRRCAPPVQGEPGGQRADGHEQTENDEPRNDRRQRRRREERVERARVGRRHRRRRRRQADQGQEHAGDRRDHADGKQEEGDG
jgi:hypothetical protein